MGRQQDKSQPEAGFWDKDYHYNRKQKSGFGTKQYFKSYLMSDRLLKIILFLATAAFPIQNGLYAAAHGYYGLRVPLDSHHTA